MCKCFDSSCVLPKKKKKTICVPLVCGFYQANVLHVLESNSEHVHVHAVAHVYETYDVT